MTTTVGSMESVGRVMHSSHGGSEGLGLGVGSVLSLERLGDGLVRNLAGRTSYKCMSSNKSMVSSSEELSRGGCYQAGDVEEDLEADSEVLTVMEAIYLHPVSWAVIV